MAFPDGDDIDAEPGLFDDLPDRGGVGDRRAGVVRRDVAEGVQAQCETFHGVHLPDD
ncbi:hypothetical protein [Streptomyces sp. NPDC018833]|uniref:hypothetical protein n=1 Tax=Streptomyces sp. NPDC018833 TaxID=3365053 RepID=UPI0037AF6D87